MRLLLDEMHAPSIPAALEPFDVTSVSGDASLRGLSDVDLLAHAATEGRALVTENVADFMLLIAEWAGDGREHAGVLFTHPRRFHRASTAYPANLIVALRAFLEEPPTWGPSLTWWL